MPPKQQLDKAAWQWAEVTDPDQVTNNLIKVAYRLNLSPCKQGSCKRNCRGNPFCLNCIGERIWFGEISDDSWHDIDDPNEERREDDMFVGLKNLGATCYVNTFLQLWFHSTEIRRAIYKYRETDIPTEGDNKWKPNSIGGHLQVIFSLLDLSKRAYICPQDFIDHLGLDAALQQDAQEFSKLFLSLLEDSLSQQKDLSVRNVIQDQFCGEYAYVTTCSKCGNSSQCHSTFYELDLHIQGNKTLQDSVREFLQEEKLDGDNQYMCSHCSSKQNAKRAIQLKTLPPVLNLQLLRFVFDKKTGHKKKLNSFIQFPEVLDMEPFISQETTTDTNDIPNKANEGSGNHAYHLRAVLIHRGPSAYSGHYIAHIKDTKSGTWYKFNDAEIEKMKGSNLHLGTEEDLPEGSNSKQKGRVPKGYHSSRNAYMLVYTKQESKQERINTEENNIDQNTADVSLLPEYILDYVKEDNEKFEMWIMELTMTRDQNIETGKEQQEEVKSTYKRLIVGNQCQSDGNYEWISCQWLSKWLEDPTKAPKIDNRNFLCQHGKVSPHMIVKLKCVSVDGIEKLYQKYLGGPRLAGDKSTCLICVKNQCRMIRTKRRMTEDDKYFNTKMKIANPAEEKCYWIGKASLRSWKRLVLEQLEEVLPGDDKNASGLCNMDDKEKNGNESDVDSTHAGEDLNTEQEVSSMEQEVKRAVQEVSEGSKEDCEKMEDSTEVSNGNQESMTMSLQFNEDLLCELHGNLDPNQSCRKLIPEEVWLRLKEYFPGCPEFPSDAAVCQKCCALNENEQQSRDVQKQLAAIQKSALSDLFNDKKRPQHLSKPQELYVLNVSFVEEWRKFIKDPCSREPVTDVMNSTLLCKHGGYMYPPDKNGLDLLENQEVVYVWPKEWESICDHFSVDLEISIVAYIEENASVKLVTLPDICRSCVKEKNDQKEQAKFDYVDAIVYVRKIPKDKPLDLTPEVAKDEDPEYIQQGGGRSKSDTDEPPEKFVKLENGTRRKSQRHRKMRGEKEVKVSSNQTLKEFKLQLMKLFSVPPFDQNLSMLGTLLLDDSASLGSLRVAPGAVISLQADEPIEDPGVLQDLMQVSAGPEEGFKGTGLLSRQ